MGKLRRSAVRVRSGLAEEVLSRLSPKRVAGLARQLVNRLSEEERLAIIGLVTTLILKSPATDPRAKLAVFVAALVVNELLSAYLEIDARLTVR